MFARRQWVPPWGLLFAQASHGVSWLLLVWIACFAGVATLSMPALAWIHLVALGWFTVAALSILLHAIPGFTDVRWRFETAARVALGAFAAGIVAFAVILCFAVHLLALAALWIVAALLCYAAVAWATLAQARNAERTEKAVARAFSVALFVLVVVALLGMLLALFLSGTFVSAWMVRLPAAHANLGMYGWLSVLIYGVSVRTVRPICGTKPAWKWPHILVGSATLAGAVILATGLGLGNAAASWSGAGLVGLGALTYAADIAAVLARATVRHRPPQAFIAASIFWLLAGVVLGASTLAGRPFEFAYVFVILVGWIGQMVNAHMLHIGTRVIATVYLGDDDETRPEELLDVKLEWAGFVAIQTSIALVAYGLATGAATFVATGGVIGFAGWAAMLVNQARARNRARSLAASQPVHVDLIRL